MTTKRLEELAAKCAVAIDGVGRNASYGLSDSDLRDLARCARAWAKVEKAENPRLECWNWPQGAKWYFRPDDRKRETSSGDTPIEAVEAAEVGK